MKAQEVKRRRAKKGCGTLAKHGKFFYAVWNFMGRRYEVSTRETTEREARKRLEEIVADFHNKHKAEAVLASVKDSLQRAARRTLKISDAFAVYENDKLRKAVAPSTMRVYRNRFRVFAAWAEGKVANVDDVSAGTARAFMSHIAETAAPKTYNDYLSILSLTWSFFIKAGYADENPWWYDKEHRKGIERKEKDTHRKCELTPAQLDALFLATSGEMRTLFFIGIFTGLRLKDCALLEWGAVDLEGGFIRLAPAKTRRHGIAVTIPILPPLARALAEARRGNESRYVLPGLAEAYRTSTDGLKVQARVRRIFHKAGIPTTSEMEGRSRRVVDFGFHSLRHTFVSMAARAGIRQAVVQEIVGHTNTAITDHYTHTNEEDLRLGLAAFPALPAPGEGGGADAPAEAAQTPQNRAGAGGATDTPADATDAAERPLDALAAMLARMDARELDEAAAMIDAARRARAHEAD